jgi:MFS family permease
MTQAISARTRHFGEWRIVAPICAAHFVSHYYMIILAPLFAFIRADYGVSYTDLALALTAFNVVSAALQTPAGFLVDHVGARIVLMAGVALGAAAFAVAGVVNSFAVLSQCLRSQALATPPITRPTIRCCRNTPHRTASGRFSRFTPSLESSAQP